jgi:tetratricopeptide (TPR) repeat protein
MFSPLKQKRLVFIIALSLLTSCASQKPETEKAVYYDSAFNDRNRAPASMSPPDDSKLTTIDPVYMRTQADYYFAMGESLSLEGEHQKAAEAFKMTLVYDVDSMTVSLRLASEYVKLGLVSEALELAEKAVEKDPKSIDGRILLGGLYSAIKMYPKAVEQYEAVLKLKSDNTEAPLYLGAILAEQKQYDRAIKYFELLASNQDYQSPHLIQYYMARVYSERGGAAAYQKSEAHYKQSLKEKPDFVDGALGLAVLYEKQNQEKKAIQFLTKFQEQSGPHVKVAELLAQHYLQAEQYDEAYEQLEILEPVAEDGLGIKVKMALILIEKKIYDKAIAKLNEILLMVPDSDKIRFYLGAVYEETKNYTPAIENFKKVPPTSSFYGESILHASYLERVQNKSEEALKTVLAGIENKKDMPQLFSLAASILDEQGQQAKASEVLASGLEQFPENAQLNFFMGTLKDKMGKKDEVVAQMKKVIAIDPNHVQGLNYLAFFYAEQNKNLEEAEKLARKALSFDTKDGFVLDTLGWVLYKQGKFAEAIKYLEAAHKDQPQEGIIAEHLGDAYFKYTLVDKARIMYMKAAEFEVDQSKIDGIKQKITALEKQEVNIVDKKINSPKRIPAQESQDYK